MANDDFMYSRQEKPREAFANNLLQSSEKKSKSDSLYHKSWKRIASIVSIIFIATSMLLLSSPEVRAFVIQTLGIDEWIAVSDEDAQDYVPFAIPQDIPEGYTRQTDWRDPSGNQQAGEVVISTYSNGVLLGRLIWEREDCYISMTVTSLGGSSRSEDGMARNEYYAERYDWIDLFDVGGVRGIWRLQTVPNQEVDRMAIEWTSLNNINHYMETSSDCLSQEDFIVMAQSTQ